MDITVFLSAGHGGSDPGAVAYDLKEKDVNLHTLLACNDTLIEHGLKTILSRTTDENDPVGEEVREANASGATLAVSFHANAGGGDGFEVYYWTTNSASKKLAELCEKYVKELGQNSRGLKSGNHLYFIKNTDMTAVLCESFFVDNDVDNDIGDTIEEQRAFGVAYAKAILEYLGIEYGKDVVVGKPIVTQPTPNKPTGYDEWVAGVQEECNHQGFSNQKVDGLRGPVTLAGCPTLKVGSKGNITRLVQERLKSVGFTKLDVDGIFGEKTKEAVEVFQDNRKLTVDGIVGKNTWNWLLKGTVM